MAEPLKAYPKSDKPRVLSLRTQDGGIEMPGGGVETFLSHGKSPTPLNQRPLYDMELDRSLGGVVVRYEKLGIPHTVLIPMAHLRMVELAE